MVLTKSLYFGKLNDPTAVNFELDDCLTFEALEVKIFLCGVVSGVRTCVLKWP